MLRALPRVALQLWIVLFIVFFGAEVVHLEPGLRVITQILYGLPLVVWAVARLRGPVDRLDWTVLGLLALYAVVCLLSRDRTESLGTLALVAGYAAWFLLMRRSASLRGPVILAIATGLVTTLAFNAYLLIEEKATWFARVDAAPIEGVRTFPWESVNALPVLVLLAIPFIAWIPSRHRSVLWPVLAFSALIVVPLSMGRAGWLGLATAALALLALRPAAWRVASRASPRLRWLRLRWLPLGASFIVVVGAAAIGTPRIVSALAESGRLLLWEQGLNMVAANPLVGAGPGTYSWVRLELPPTAADLIAVRLIHSPPLQTLVDGGMLLALGAVGGFAVWAGTAGRRTWQAGDRVAVATLMGFAATLTLDDFSYLPAITAATLTIAAFLVPVQVLATRDRRGWIAPLVIGIAAAVATPSVVAVDSARAAAQDGRTAMVAGRISDAVRHFDFASRSHPENGGYWLGLGMAYAYAGDASGAIAAYERATRVAPGDARGYAALAHLGGPGEAVERLRAAAGATLDDPQDSARLGLALAERGDTDAATHAWARAVALRPEVLRLLPYDSAGVSMRSVADEAALVLQAGIRPTQQEIDSALWDMALALDELPDDAGVAWRAVDAARHGDLRTADALASEAVRAAPYQARGHQATAAVATFACDVMAEERALELERQALGAYVDPDPEPRAVREFIYREASLGPSQPAGARMDLRIERWPWSLVDRPECDA